VSELPALFSSSPATQGRLLALETPRGPERRALLESWARELRAQGATRTWVLPCDVGQEGLWAGPSAWLADLLPQLRSQAPDLTERHDREIVTILPEARLALQTRKLSLTDVAAPTESVRNYAVDRAYRLGQGMVELLDAWHQRTGGGSWGVLCDDFDRVGALAARFFRELVRRRGHALGLRLVLAVEPGAGAALIERFPGVPGTVLALPLATRPAPSSAPEELSRQAEELEQRVGQDPLEIEIHLPQLIRLWSASSTPQRALRWHAMALGLYNHHGFYEDALAHAPAVQANLDLIASQDPFFTRWNLVGSLFGCHVAVGDVQSAYRIVKEEGLDKIDDPGDVARISYVMAMLHARFLPKKDLALAETYLTSGLEQLQRAVMEPRDRHFLRVFLLNGLAFIRHRQGRPAEAVALCEDGFAQLQQNLESDQHRLHRSVLLYNMAQVHAAVGEHERALEAFAGAMQMDPNYSEYHNERGCVFLALGRFEEALRDFHEAIRLSAPYAEVWTNLGQCLRDMGRADEAVAAYSHALDIEPGVQLALLGRAQCLDALGRRDEALADYDASLAADPHQPLTLANRAALHYERGDIEASLADLDAAIALAPEEAQLHCNRAMALADLRRPEDAARDLATYLRLSPEAEDRQEVEARIGMLRGPIGR
jgi:tetratricopeptide (TPR) repeat protein